MTDPDTKISSLPLPGSLFSVQCRHCGQKFEKLNTDSFSVIECPYCGCPDYQGRANHSQSILAERQYQRFVAQKKSRKTNSQPPKHKSKGQQIKTQCRYCEESFLKIDTEIFSLITCPNCGCPDYQGNVRPSQIVLFESKYQEFLSRREKAQTSPPEKSSKLSSTNTPDSRAEPSSTEKIIRQESSHKTKEIPVITPHSSTSLPTPRKQQKTSTPSDSPFSEIQSSPSQDILARIGELNTRVNKLEQENQELKKALQHIEQVNKALQGQIRQSLDRVNQDIKKELTSIENQIRGLEKDESSQSKPLKSRSLPGGISVEMTDQTVRDCLNNNHQNIIFEERRNGRYWIKTIRGSYNNETVFYLMLRGNINFTPESLVFIQVCFEIKNPENPSRQFEIIRPAFVEPITSSKEWTLLKRGKLEFLSSQEDDHV